MADKTENAAKLMSGVTTDSTMSMLDRLNQQMKTAFGPTISSSLTALEAEMSALRAARLAAACPPQIFDHSPSFNDVYSLAKSYQFDWNAKNYSMVEEWKPPLDSWTETSHKIQNTYSDYFRQLEKLFTPDETARLLGMSESVFKTQAAAMQSVASYYAYSNEDQLTQIRDLASHFEVNDITSLAAGLFPRTVADYLRANPLTKAEWEKAASEPYADAAAQGLAEISDVLEAPEQNRGQIIRFIWCFIFLFLAAYGQAMAPDGQISVAKVWWYFFSFFCLRTSEHVPQVLQQWKSGSGHRPPLATVVAADGKDVPVRKTGNPRSAILRRIPVGMLISLATEGTKEMKAVVEDIDENGDVIEIAWISRRNLKPINMKQAYALKKALPN